MKNLCGFCPSETVSGFVEDAFAVAFVGEDDLVGAEVFLGVWQCLADDGLDISYEAFRKVLQRVRKRAHISAPPRGKSLELLKTRLAVHTKNVIRPHFENLVAQLTEKPPKPITISNDGEKLFISYPSRFGTSKSVFLEFGGRNVISPNEEHPLRPYISAEIPDRKRKAVMGS